ncbi:MAG: DEAD/DEAH box helicase [Puniceicoccales bacterium]|jgi:ATP-dependent helicase HrpB|nr:DEAD/DEAH box helicase [Puniceicoccales bacterium]
MGPRRNPQERLTTGGSEVGEGTTGDALRRANLPIFNIREELREAAKRTRRVVLQAPTGSGKSTQIPQFLLDDGVVPAGQKIVVLQPRRLATRMLAARIARERGQQLGGEVGYQIRFDRVESPATRIKFVTEGLLLRQMLSDPRLEGVGALVFDEFHERHLDSDLALARARQLQESTRPDLLIVVMSATLDTEGLMRWLGSEGGITKDELRITNYADAVHFEQSRGEASMERAIVGEDVLDAMSRPAIGAIAFFAGDHRQGIRHIIEARNADGLDGLAIVRRMPAVIANGLVTRIQGENTTGERIHISHGGDTAILSLFRNGQQQAWLLTGWKNNDGADGGNPNRAYAPDHHGISSPVGASARIALLNEHIVKRENKSKMTGASAPPVLLAVEGRLFPITVAYAGKSGTGGGGGGNYAPQIWDVAAAAFRRAAREEPEGDFLVFMPGAYEIQRTLDAIGATPEARGMALLPLHGELPPEQQDAAVAPAPAGVRKVVVSTNVAETSLTIDGVRVVIDSGLARVARFDPHRGINTLLIENISQASAEQRAGRAGRTAPGLCVRLWSKSEHESRPARETPEVRRVELAEPVLALKAGGVTDLDAFPWFERPAEKSLARALELLTDLGALEPLRADITPLGRRMAAFPAHPRYARMLLAAGELGCRRQVAVIAALTQGRDIMLPLDDRRAREEREELLGDTDSDFFHRLTLYGMARRKNFDFGFCRRWGIHAQAAKMADRLAEHFERIAAGNAAAGTSSSLPAPCSPLPAPDTHTSVRKCLLIGFSDHLAMRLDKGTLRCALVHNRKGELRRDSAVRAAKTPLFVAAEVEEIETRGDITVFLDLATTVEEEWLAELFPDDLNERVTTRYDTTLKRCFTRRERRFRDLVLDAREREDNSGSDAAARLLADEVLAGRLVLERWDAKVEHWLNKVNYAAKNLPELEIAPVDDAARRMLLEELCAGATAWHQIRDKDVWPTLHGWLTAEQHAALDALLPDRLHLPYKNRSAAIEYTADGEAVLGARLQDLYDTPGAHFRIAGGRLPLVIEIQSPARRCFQRTTDLDAFWRTSYEAVKKDLRGRYPKHEWR